MIRQSRINRCRETASGDHAVHGRILRLNWLQWTTLNVLSFYRLSSRPRKTGSVHCPLCGKLGTAADRPELADSRGSSCSPTAAVGKIRLLPWTAGYELGRKFTLSAKSGLSDSCSIADTRPSPRYGSGGGAEWVSPGKLRNAIAAMHGKTGFRRRPAESENQSLRPANRAGDDPNRKDRRRKRSFVRDGGRALTHIVASAACS